MLKKEMKEQNVQEIKQSESGKCFYLEWNPASLHKGEASACVFVKSNTSPQVLYKWYQVA